MKTENIDSIVIHCSDTPYMQDVKAADIDKFHKKKGWKMIGYNYVIDLDGTIEAARATGTQPPGLSALLDDPDPIVRDRARRLFAGAPPPVS